MPERKYPEEIYEIIEKATVENKDDIQKATDAAVEKIRVLDCYEQYVDILVHDHVRSMVHEVRCEVNRDIKKEYTGPGGHTTPKQRYGSSKSFQNICSVYNLFIAGKTLGDTLGKDIPELMETEQSQINGHRFNYELLKRLKPLVPSDKTVRQAVKVRKLQTIYRQAKSTVNALEGRRSNQTRGGRKTG